MRVLKKRKGIQKIVTEIILKEYVPINDRICTDSSDQYQVYPIKFQGNPVNILPLKNSKIEKINAKNRIKLIFFSANLPTIKVVNPKNKDKNKGINIKENGIKYLKLSS